MNRPRTVPYDLVRELAIALAGSLVMLLVLAAVFSSPDLKAETIQGWAQADPADFAATANAELSGDAVSSNYGPPYNHGDGSVQSLAFFSPQSWFGARIPVDSAREFVIGPLQSAARTDAELNAALMLWDGAKPEQQSSWTTAYGDAVKKATDASSVDAIAGDRFGPLPVIIGRLLRIAQDGGLDGFLLAAHSRFYSTDYTEPLLFMGDGGYLAGLAKDQHLLGDQWGMMNETGTYPGQTWLWLYTLWYQLPPFAGNSNADLMVVLTMGVLSVLLVLVPFIPGLRDIPRWVPIHRLIWRRYYSSLKTAS